MRRRGDWIQTYTGRKFWPLDPRPEEIFIEDVAHALALQCRFIGHCRVPYSVAEHSWRMSCRLPLWEFHAPPGPYDGIAHLDQVPAALWALLHDAPEAYLGDFARPLKYSRFFGWFYRRAERRLMRAICERYSLPRQEPESVKWADRVMLLWEQRDLMGIAPDSWGIQDSRFQIPERRLEPFSASLIERLFLSRFKRLRERLEREKWQWAR